MSSQQNTHRKVAFRCCKNEISTNLLYFFLLFSFGLLTSPTTLSHQQQPDSGTGYFHANRKIAAKKNPNGLLPLLNIRSPKAKQLFMATEEHLPNRTRRRRTSYYCKPDNFRDLVFHTSSNEESDSREGDSAGPHPEAYVYAITQDCQIIFARAEQMHQISRMIEVNNRLTYCLPGLIHLHWRETEVGGIGLQLLLKRTNRQICTLPVEFPQANSLLGSTIFSYSLRSSLNYAVCSFMSNSSFVMEPELSFMDTTYSDVIYFVDPNSFGAYWTVRQFKLDEKGYFKALDTFIVRNIAEQDSKYTGRPQRATEYFMVLDAQRKKIFAIHKQKKSLVSTCAYDLLFRPHRVIVERSSLASFEVSSMNMAASQYSDQNYHEVTSFSVDHSAIMYAEVFRKGDDKYLTKLFVTNKLNNQSSPNCVLEVPFRAKFGFITTQSLEQLNEIQLPKFSAAQMKHYRKSAGKDKYTTASPPKNKTLEKIHAGDGSDQLTQDQLLPSTSTTTLPTSTISSKLEDKSMITTIKLVMPTTTKSPYITRRPTTSRNRFQAKSTDGFGITSEEGQLLNPTSFKEPQQKGRMTSLKGVEANTMDDSFPAGYSDYENSEEDNGFHGGGDNPLGLLKTDERGENAQGVSTSRWQSTRKAWLSTPTTVKTIEKEETDEQTAHANTFADRGEPSSSVKIGFASKLQRMAMIIVSSLIAVDITFGVLFL